MIKHSSPLNVQIAAVACAFTLAFSSSASAQNIEELVYDAAAKQLVAKIAYQGTNPDHKFRLQWGPCQAGSGQSPSTADAEILDDQWADIAQRDFSVQARFDMGGFPCRPALVTLRMGPRVTRTVLVP